MTKSAKAPKPKAKVDWGILHDLVGFHLRRAQSVVFDNFMQLSSNERVTPGQFGVLTLIEANPGLNQSGLASALGIERSTMVAVINMLEERGFVRRQESPTDRRSYILSLTAEGVELLNRSRENVRLNEAMISSVMSGEEKKLLVDLLKRISDKSD